MLWLLPSGLATVLISSPVSPPVKFWPSAALKKFTSRLPNTHLVMHGSSSVPQEWLDMINEYGGNIPETYGVPVEEIQKGIKSGVRKVNIDTDNRLAITAAIREAA
jgi:fructose-bisphosphate aldolase class II